MSPRRLDPSVVEIRLTTMSRLLDDLERFPIGDLEHDARSRYAVERVLTQLVELATSVNEHVVGAVLHRTATSYRDSFLLAAECGLIDETLRDDLLPSIGMRNVLVHEYVRVDLRLVAAAVPLALDGYRRYVRAAAAFVADRDT
ncbi:type VII toxin-antitoxin system HepT family RNase toxin [Actinomycetospora sp. CA-084318]|uniref:type VII toxin-antitoxin system HepT family RNase toxin n=1 Tax=Actinomycetospora sp. CA-084318 TaxID=3239892 RepID=UPI003D9840D4